MTLYCVRCMVENRIVQDHQITAGLYAEAVTIVDGDAVCQFHVAEPGPRRS